MYRLDPHRVRWETEQYTRNLKEVQCGQSMEDEIGGLTMQYPKSPIIISINISIQRMMGDPWNGLREEWHTLTCPLQLPLH